MKKLFIVFVLLITMGLWGYTSWEENGKAIRQETNLNYSGSVIHLSDGNYMLMWSDASGGRQEMRIQKISATGEPVWAAPVLLSDREYYYPNGQLLVETSDGEIVAAWYELGDPTLLRLQRIDINGNLLWSNDGIIIEIEEEDGCFPLRMVSNGTSGIYLVWRSDIPPTEIRAINLDANGDPETGWNSSGRLLYPESLYLMNMEVLPDGFGGIIVLAYNQDYHLYFQRCDSEANLHWGSDGLMVEGPFDNNEMALLNWEYGQYAFVSRQEYQLLMNIVDFSGSFIFEEMQPVISINEGYESGSFKVVRTSDGKLGMICYETDNTTNANIYAQKTEPGEIADWGNNGVLLGESEIYNNYYYYGFDLVADQNGGLAFIWESQEDGIFNINYQHLDLDGNYLVDNESVILGTSLQSDWGYRIFRDCGNSVMFWSPYRYTNKEIVEQIYDNNEEPQLTETGNTLWSVLGGTSWDNKSVIIAHDNLTAVCWLDERNLLKQVYVQMINNDTGELYFEIDGMAATEFLGQEHSNPSIAFSESGARICTAYGVESENNYPGTIQIFDTEGNRMLGDNGSLFCEDLNIQDIRVGGAGGNDFILIWSESNGDFINPLGNLKVQKIENNQFAWEDGISLVENTSYDYGDFSILYPYVTWLKMSFPNFELRMTRLSNDGSIAEGWCSEGLLIADYCKENTARLYETDSGVIIFWIDNSAYPVYQFMYRTISSEGEFLGEVTEIDLYENHEVSGFTYIDGYIYILQINDNFQCCLAKYNLDGIKEWEIDAFDWGNSSSNKFSIWEDVIIVYGKNDELDIYAKIYNTDGNPIPNMPEGGIEVCTQQHEQNLKDCITDANGNNIVLWEDARGEYVPLHDPSLYVQKIDLSTVPVLDDDLPQGDLVNMRNYPNPFCGSTTLKCELPRNVENAEIVIYNIKGQKVRSLFATSNEIEWDCFNDAGKPAGAGVYFYRLYGKGVNSNTGRMILLR